MHDDQVAAEMREKLAAYKEKGFVVFTATEYVFTGPCPETPQADGVSEQPDNTRILTFIEEHENHWHLYQYVLTKPELRPVGTKMYDAIMTKIAAREMEARATVQGVAGRA